MTLRTPRASTPRLSILLFALGAALGCSGLPGLQGLSGLPGLQGPSASEIAAMPLSDVIALADGGDDLAQHQLCYGYSYGTGVEQDYARAFVWCSRASQNPERASSQTLLGDLYLHGRGVEEDATEARRWYSAAAERGHAHAQFMMGVMYEQGRGVAPSPDDAREWYEVAAANGSSLATDRLNQLDEK